MWLKIIIETMGYGKCIYGFPFEKLWIKRYLARASLVGQWLRVHLPMQETLVWSPIQEDPTCLWVTKPMGRNYWACAVDPGSHNHWVMCHKSSSTLEHVLYNKRGHLNEKPRHHKRRHCNAKPMQSETRAKPGQQKKAQHSQKQVNEIIFKKTFGQISFP